jgi:hypothetical protein
VADPVLQIPTLREPICYKACTLLRPRNAATCSQNAYFLTIPPHSRRLRVRPHFWAASTLARASPTCERHEQTRMPHLFHQHTWIDSRPNPCKQIMGFFLRICLEHLQQSLQVLVLTLQQYRFRLSILAWTISGQTLLAYGTHPVTLMAG